MGQYVVLGVVAYAILAVALMKLLYERKRGGATPASDRPGMELSLIHI